MEYAWTCASCGCQHEDLPTCWSFGPPVSWLLAAPEERETHGELTEDLCAINGHWFIRGGIEIPILETSEVLAFIVWVSLSEASMQTVVDTWDDADRAGHGPFFGWLNTDVVPYTPTVSLPSAVHIREPGLIPLVVPHASDHALSVAQQSGVTRARAVEIAELLLPRH